MRQLDGGVVGGDVIVGADDDVAVPAAAAVRGDDAGFVAARQQRVADRRVRRLCVDALNFNHAVARQQVGNRGRGRRVGVGHGSRSARELAVEREGQSRRDERIAGDRRVVFRKRHVRLCRVIPQNGHLDRPCERRNARDDRLLGVGSAQRTGNAPEAVSVYTGGVGHIKLIGDLFGGNPGKGFFDAQLDFVGLRLLGLPYGVKRRRAGHIDAAAAEIRGGFRVRVGAPAEKDMPAARRRRLGDREGVRIFVFAGCGVFLCRRRAAAAVRVILQREGFVRRLFEVVYGAAAAVRQQDGASLASVPGAVGGHGDVVNLRRGAAERPEVRRVGQTEGFVADVVPAEVQPDGVPADRGYPVPADVIADADLAAGHAADGEGRRPQLDVGVACGEGCRGKRAEQQSQCQQNRRYSVFHCLNSPFLMVWVPFFE